MPIFAPGTYTGSINASKLLVVRVESNHHNNEAPSLISGEWFDDSYQNPDKLFCHFKSSGTIEADSEGNLSAVATILGPIVENR